MSQFEAALNLLREERRAVMAARSQIMRDEDLKRADPGHRGSLLAQTMAELAQLARAITLLERVQSGDLVEMDLPAPPPTAPLVARAPEMRMTGLVRRTPGRLSAGGAA